MNRKRTHKRYELENLKPRILLSGDPLVAALASLAPADPESEESAPTSLEEVLAAEESNAYEPPSADSESYDPSSPLDDIFSGLTGGDVDEPEEPVGADETYDAHFAIGDRQETQILLGLTELVRLGESVELSEVMASALPGLGDTPLGELIGLVEILDSRLAKPVYDYFGDAVDLPTGEGILQALAESLNTLGDLGIKVSSLEGGFVSADGELRFDVAFTATREGQLLLGDEETGPDQYQPADYLATLKLDISFGVAPDRADSFFLFVRAFNLRLTVSSTDELQPPEARVDVGFGQAAGGDGRLDLGELRAINAGELDLELHKRGSLFDEASAKIAPSSLRSAIAADAGEFTESHLVGGVDPVQFGSVTFNPGSAGESTGLADLLDPSALLGSSLTFNADINLNGFVRLTGEFTITVVGNQTFDIATGLPANAVDLLALHGSTIEDETVFVWTLTATNVQAFIGLNGPYQTDSDGNGIIEGSELTNVNLDAVGLAVTNLNVAAVFMSSLGLPKLHALKATAASAALVGMDGVLEASATNIVVEVNSGETWFGGFGPPVADFAASFPGGYTVGAFDFSDLDGNQRIGASAATVQLSLANFVHVTGSFSFQKGPTHKVDVATGLPANVGDLVASLAAAIGDANVLPTSNPHDGTLWIESDLSVIHNLEVDSLQIGASSVYAFIGVNGPARTDTNGDGVINGADDPADSDAVGIVVENVAFGYVAMSPTLSAFPGFDQFLPDFSAARATADLAALVGFGSVLTASLENIVVEVNDGSAWPGGLGPPVVDFSTSFAADEILDYFDVDGVPGIRVADLRDDAAGAQVASVAGLYDGGTAASQVITAAQLIDALGGADGRLELADVTAAGFGDASGSDADGDGKLDPPGYEIRTGTGTAPVYITYDGNQRIGASVGRAEMRLSGFVHVIGSVSFQKGPTHRVDVATGLSTVAVVGLETVLSEFGLLPDTDPALDANPNNDDTLWIEPDFSVIHNVEVDSLQIGGSNIHVFIGTRGPYWTDANKDFIIDPGEIDDQAVGITISGVAFGFATMAPTLSALPGLDGILPKFTTLKATADLAALVGVDDITLSAEGIEVNLNDGTPWPANEGPPVIDFSSSFTTDEVLAYFNSDGLGGITVGDMKALGFSHTDGVFESGDPNGLTLDSADIVAGAGRGRMGCWRSPSLERWVTARARFRLPLRMMTATANSTRRDTRAGQGQERHPSTSPTTATSGSVPAASG